VPSQPERGVAVTASLQPTDALGLLADIDALARRAGALILDVYRQDFAVWNKADASQLTLADERAEACIVPALRALTPGVPVVAEEACAAGELPLVGSKFWLVDPLDGTREFVQRNDEFTVNIALVEHGVPVLGVVHAPALDLLYAGWAPAAGLRQAWLVHAGQRRQITGRVMPAVGCTVAASRAHGDGPVLQAWLAAQCVAGLRAVGSALKFGLLAAGEADVYPRFGRTMEWDTAAGHALLRAAGGEVLDLQGRPLRYGKPGFDNPHFVAWSRVPAVPVDASPAAG
jgi:3'(2'), 5'-bisphosphate nucleotidase